MSKLKILHLVNEKSGRVEDLSYNPRVAFRELANEGIIHQPIHFSFLADWIKHGDPGITKNNILELVKVHLPNVLFWQHIEDFPVDDTFFARLRGLHPKIQIVYHEGDPYGRFFKRFSKSMKCLIKHADMVFWEGLGELRKWAVQYGAKSIYFSPSNFDTDRFLTPWDPYKHRKFDVVVIASIAKTRVPFVYFPGGYRRKRMVEKLEQTFRNRLALYGHGWSNKMRSYKGPLGFGDQVKAIRQGWISVNWDHFDHIGFYNSNRLPISLAAGVPHITTYHPGFEYLYRDIKQGLYFARTPAEVIDIACYLLSKSPDKLIEEGLMAQEYAVKHLSSTKVYKDIILKIYEKSEPLPEPVPV